MGTVLDEAMRSTFADGKAIRFVQIGGNDGIHQDPLYRYHLGQEFNFEWGHIFEPIPEYFEQLAINMSPYSYVTCHELAVDTADSGGTREFSYVSEDDISRHRLPPSAKGIGSFSLQTGATPYPQSKYDAVKNYIRTITVKTISVFQLVNNYAGANVLITDCEGYDTSLIDAAFRYDMFRPEVVQFEDHGQENELLGRVLDRLVYLDYRITQSGKDYICKLPSR